MYGTMKIFGWVWLREKPNVKEEEKINACVNQSGHKSILV